MSNIKRSTYQKVVEENKRLLADIELLVSTEPNKAAALLFCFAKWTTKFEEAKQMDNLIHSAVKQYIKDHPEEVPEFSGTHHIKPTKK